MGIPNRDVYINGGGEVGRTSQPRIMWPGALQYPPEVKNGFWGPTTATIDWCEENYVISKYIAEFVNTLTNSVFIFLALYSLRNAVKQKLELRFVLAAIGFALVGIGSWLFHMTLRYEFQLLDELPMIYGTCIPCWNVFQTNVSKSYSRKLAMGIATGALLLTAIYLHFKNPTIHQAAYGILNLVIIVKSCMDVRKYVKDKAVWKQFDYILVSGLTQFLLGYFLWNLDIHLCNYWRGIRRAIGLPYGLVIEGHGWWHLLTGSGVYFYMQYLEYLRCFILGTDEQYKLSWKFNFLPVVELKQPGEAKVKSD